MKKPVLTLFTILCLLSTAFLAVSSFRIQKAKTSPDIIPIAIGETQYDLTCSEGTALNFTFHLVSMTHVGILVYPTYFVDIAVYINWDGTQPTLDDFDEVMNNYPLGGDECLERSNVPPGTYYFMVYNVEGEGGFDVAMPGPVINLNSGIHYATIQHAIDASETLDGHTIFVHEGIYYENVVVDKSLNLVGENRRTTIIDGQGNGKVVQLEEQTHHVKIVNFTLRNSGLDSYYGSGIFIGHANDNVIEHNIVVNCTVGIYLCGSYTDNNIVSNNVVSLINHTGIEVLCCHNNTLVGNIISDIKWYGISLTSTGFGHGCSNTIVTNNIVSNSSYGIGLLESWNNSLTHNSFSSNWKGIQISRSNNNNIYYNSLMNNYMQVDSHNSTNDWDDGYPSGGNYWSDYNGTDSNKDGIGDIPYMINEEERDNYPLMGMFSSFNTTLGQDVDVVSNSTIEDFEYFESNSTIKMYISGEDRFGFCRVSIPYTGLGMNLSNISVIIDNGLTPVIYPNYTLYDNGTHRWIYFAYEHSTHEIDIVPEFLPFLILPLFIIATLLVVLIFKRKSRTPRESTNKYVREKGRKGQW